MDTTGSVDAKLAEAYFDGIVQTCKSAGLCRDDAEVVVREALVGEKSAWRETAVKYFDKARPYFDKAWKTVLQTPTPALTGALGAAASVPLTAVFGRRDERGRKEYLQHALMGGAIGAGIPHVVPSINKLTQAKAQLASAKGLQARKGIGLGPKAQRWLGGIKEKAVIAAPGDAVRKRLAGPEAQGVTPDIPWA